ncbi:TPA: NrdH-redoxin [Candidatus Bathyarchaeota archaeon]|nr:NrdH-redoxin [Candidatus Bathyarchaeota archaeon]
MSETNSVARVYSLPDCKKCEVLKAYMKEKGIPFEAKWFDTEAQTEFVMMNMFGNPPVLVLGDRVASAEDMFPGGVLSEGAVSGVLNAKEG